MDEGRCISSSVEHTQAFRIEGADPGAILAKLHSLWSAVSREALPEVGAEPAGPAPVTRACILSLVVVLRQRADREQTCEAMARLVHSHPARFIVLLEDEALSPGKAVSEVSAFCALSPRPSRKVCCEQIVVRVASDLLESLAQTVEALFVPDLYRYLWWQHSELWSSPLYRRLAAVVDRTIIDTQLFCDGRAGLPRVLHAVRSSRHATFTDLNWARLTSWREMTAQLFDSSEHRQLLDSLDEVEIAASTPVEQGVSAAALLYAGWLASRLGWSASGKEEASQTGWSVRYLAGSGRGVTVRLTSLSRPGFEGRVVRVAMHALFAREAQLEMTLSQSMDSVSIRVRVGQETLRESCASFGLVPLHELLAQELNYAERDLGYETALSSATQLAEVLSR